MGLEKALPHVNSFIPAWGLLHRARTDMTREKTRLGYTPERYAGYYTGAILELERDIPVVLLAAFIPPLAVPVYVGLTIIEDLMLRPPKLTNINPEKNIL